MNKKIFTIITVLAVFFLTSCSVFENTQRFFQKEMSSVDSTESEAIAVVAPAANESLTINNAGVMSVVQQTFQDIYKKVNPSVVNIQVVEDYGWTSISGEGSGFIWNEDGYIVTNNHVVENAFEITVIFADGTTTKAEIVGTDPQSDLAVIKVDPEGLPLVPVVLGDSRAVAVGDLVIAIGNPYGLSGTMTQGIVSALSRSLTVDESSMFSRTNYTIPDIIQTDAAINPGNSGGVLVNVTGEVIGVTAAIKSSTDSNAGIGFVIPSHIVTRVIPVLIAKGSYAHPAMGLNGITMTLALAEEMGLDGNTKGILITDIYSGGAAEQAGLNGSYQRMTAPGRVSITYGDVIIAVDGQPVESYEEMVSYIFNHTEVGQTISVTVLRNGKQLEKDLKLLGG